MALEDGAWEGPRGRWVTNCSASPSGRCSDWENISDATLSIGALSLRICCSVFHELQFVEQNKKETFVS